MREREHFVYEYDDDSISDERTHESEYHDYDDTHDYDNSNEYGNEMARSAVERFLEAESVDTHTEPEHVHLQQEELPGSEDTKRSVPAAKLNNDEEYMNRLADARRERQRLREQNPVPKPAVRVNVERPRRSQPFVIDKPPADEDWTPMPADEFDSFRKRYSDPHVMAPREVKANERTRNTAAAPRRDADAPVEGPNPLRYMLFILSFGVLLLMALLAFNNRTLRLDIARHEAMATSANEYTAEVARLGLALDEYRADNAGLRNDVESLTAQLMELGYYTGTGYYNPDAPPPYGTPGRPADEAGYTPAEAPPPPPAPGPVVHIVERGQNLTRIANQHFGSSTPHYINLIVAANNLASPDDIFIGQELTIPARD